MICTGRFLRSRITMLMCENENRNSCKGPPSCGPKIGTVLPRKNSCDWIQRLHPSPRASAQARFQAGGLSRPDVRVHSRPAVGGTGLAAAASRGRPARATAAGGRAAPGLVSAAGLEIRFEFDLLSAEIGSRSVSAADRGPPAQPSSRRSRPARTPVRILLGVTGGGCRRFP